MISFQFFLRRRASSGVIKSAELGTKCVDKVNRNNFPSDLNCKLFLEHLFAVLNAGFVLRVLESRLFK